MRRKDLGADSSGWGLYQTGIIIFPLGCFLLCLLGFGASVNSEHGVQRNTLLYHRLLLRQQMQAEKELGLGADETDSAAEAEPWRRGSGSSKFAGAISDADDALHVCSELVLATEPLRAFGAQRSVFEGPAPPPHSLLALTTPRGGNGTSGFSLSRLPVQPRALQGHGVGHGHTGDPFRYVPERRRQRVYGKWGRDACHPRVMEHMIVHHIRLLGRRPSGLWVGVAHSTIIILSVRALFLLRDAAAPPPTPFCSAAGSCWLLPAVRRRLPAWRGRLGACHRPTCRR